MAKTITMNSAQQIEVLCCRLEVQKKRIGDLEAELAARRGLNDELRRENTQLDRELLAAAKTIGVLLEIVSIQDKKLGAFRQTFKEVIRYDPGCPRF
jgi:hypothetical protein